MRALRAFGLALICTVFSACAQADLEVGQPAPDFNLPGSDGNTHRLSDLRGQHVVIAFFPKAYTSG